MFREGRDMLPTISFRAAPNQLRNSVQLRGLHDERFSRELHKVSRPVSLPVTTGMC